MEKKSTVLSVRVTDELFVLLNTIAYSNRVTLSYLVCSVLTAFVDGYKKNNK